MVLRTSTVPRLTARTLDSRLSGFESLGLSFTCCVVSGKLLNLSGLCSPSKKNRNRDFPGGPEVKNLPTDAGAMGSIPVKIPHASEQLSTMGHNY